MEVKTKYPGIYKIPQGYRIRVYAKQARTGQRKEVVKTLEGANIQEALRARGQLREELQRLGPASERLTLLAYAQRWIEEHSRRDRFSTIYNRIHILEEHVLPDLGNLYLDELTPLILKDWQKRASLKSSQRSRPYDPRTVNGWLRVLKAMIREAIGDLDLARDPTLGLRALPETGAEESGAQALTAEEVQRFLGLAKTEYPEHFPMILLGFCTGMRFGELSALHWEDVDLDRGMVHIRRSQVRGHVALPKTNKRRHVPISPEVVAVLCDHRRRLLEQQAPGLDKGLVFPNEKGGYHSVTFLAKPFCRLSQLLGLPGRFTPHGMRHTFNTLVVEAGVDRAVLWSMVGHSSERMTEHYAHVGETAKRQVTDQLARLILFPIGSKAGVEASGNG